MRHLVYCWWRRFAIGRASAAATHPDGRLVTAATPAAPDEWISVYSTGLGQVKRDLTAGTTAPVSPFYETFEAVRAEIAGRSVEASVACLAPAFVGLYQINVRVPQGVPTGPQDLQLYAAGKSSNQVVRDVR